MTDEPAIPAGLESILPEDAPRIRLPEFEGPLDLLLYLIKKNQVDIHDIPIAPITRQYMEYLDLMKELSLDVAGEFMVMAATLIHIKSKMLVPVNPTEAEGEEGKRRACCTRSARSAPPRGLGPTPPCPPSTTRARR